MGSPSHDIVSTYDEYVSEVDSGHLVWSPAHESEDFWNENGMRIGQESGGKAVKYAQALYLIVLTDGLQTIGRLAQDEQRSRSSCCVCTRYRTVHQVWRG